MSDRILTTWDACRLADIIRAAQGNQPVARLAHGVVVYGTARSIGNEVGMFSGPTDDVRDLYLRVTSQSGFEHFWPVAQLMVELNEGTFAVNFPAP